MERKEVYDRVVKIVQPFARDEAAAKAISETTHILKDLKVNSARLVDIAIAFEDEFKIAIDDSQAAKVQTVGDAVTVVLANLQKK
jgi:acyl carrier protein